MPEGTPERPPLPAIAANLMNLRMINQYTGAHYTLSDLGEMAEDEVLRIVRTIGVLSDRERFDMQGEIERMRAEHGR